MIAEVSMHDASMLRTRMMSALIASTFGLSLAGLPATATAGDAFERSTVRLAQHGCTMLGPYATMRRANEVANEARGYGRSAMAFHNGDGYYVRVC
jgi:hypothetical protein